MGLIFDSSILILGERKGWTAARAIEECIVASDLPDEEFGISAVTLTELTHGLERAQTESQRHARSIFLNEIMRVVPVIPATDAICIRAGHISGRLNQQGLTIGLADALIAATALELNWSVVTGNTKHFRWVASLGVIAHPPQI